MSSLRVIRKANGTAGSILFRPFVVLAARVLGPGPTRLRLVKLAHNLNRTGLTVVEPESGVAERPAAQQPTSRAA